MVLRIALFAMLALGVIGGSAIVWVLLMVPVAVSTTDAGLAAPMAKSIILAAAHPLRAGALIKPEDLAALEILNAEVLLGASLDTPRGRGNLTGAMIRRSLGEGQTILPADVVHPGDHGFLAAVLGQGMRAITVAVDAVSGTAGLIWPGDRVDLILTQALDDQRLAVGRRVAAETVLSDARVIAVDQQIVQGQAPDGATPSVNRTATLEVTASQAERVLVAGRLGTLSLSVLAADRRIDATPRTSSPAPYSARPLVVGGTTMVDGPASTRVTWAGDVSPALGSGEPRNAPVKVQVFQGGADGKEFHF